MPACLVNMHHEVGGAGLLCASSAGPFRSELAQGAGVGRVCGAATNADPKAGCVLCDAKAIHAGHALPIQTVAGKRASTGKALGKTVSLALFSVSGMPDLALSGRHPRNLWVAVGSHWLIQRQGGLCVGRGKPELRLRESSLAVRLAKWAALGRTITCDRALPWRGSGKIG